MQDRQYMQLMGSYAPAWGFGGPIRLMYDYARWMIDNDPSHHVQPTIPEGQWNTRLHITTSIEYGILVDVCVKCRSVGSQALPL